VTTVDGFVWLHNAETDGYFNCPDDAVEHMTQLGWEPSDPPIEINLAVAERLAWEAEQAELRKQAEADAAEQEAVEKKSKPAKAARRGDSATEE
jgi:hypothetical protein